MEYESEIQDLSFGSVGSTQSNLLSEISVVGYEERLNSETDEPVEPDESGILIFDEPGILDELENSKLEFPNEAYKDLMFLVTNHKLNNKAGNAIIRFFNKHSTLPKSPLPKSIENGRKFMNNMNFPNLVFNKILITNHNGKDYFLHYQNLIHCIKHILSVPNITQNFALSFENYEVQVYALFNYQLNYHI